MQSPTWLGGIDIRNAIDCKWIVVKGQPGPNIVNSYDDTGKKKQIKL